MFLKAQRELFSDDSTMHTSRASFKINHETPQSSLNTSLLGMGLEAMTERYPVVAEMTQLFSLVVEMTQLFSLVVEMTELVHM